MTGDVLPLWKEHQPLRSYLYGMHAFGLAQTGKLDEAAKNAKIGIELNQVDGWATHALCHVYEYSGETNAGVKYLLDTESDWSQSNMSNHNYWHLCLYYIEQNEHEKCIDVIEAKLNSPRTNLDKIDLVSLMLRLRLDDFRSNPQYIQQKYAALKKKFMQNLSSHGFPYFDIHRLGNATTYKII